MAWVCLQQVSHSSYFCKQNGSISCPFHISSAPLGRSTTVTYKLGFHGHNFEESVEGLHAVGAPITDEDDVAIGAISISGPANRLDGTLLREELPSLLLGTVNEITINLAHA